MKSFSSSSFAADHAVALELAAEAVKDDPYALFTNFQWFLLAGRDLPSGSLGAPPVA